MYKFFLRFLFSIFIWTSCCIAYAQPFQEILKNIDSAIANYDYVNAHNRILQNSKSTNDSILLMSLQMRELQTLRQIELYDESILVSNNLLNNSLLGSEEKVDVLLFKALAYENLGDLDNTKKVLDMAGKLIDEHVHQKKPQSKVIGKFYVRKSSYFRIKHMQKALESYNRQYISLAQKALAFNQKYNYQHLVAESYMLLSFNPKLNKTESHQYLFKALNIWKRLGDRNAVAQMYANLTLININNPELAKIYHDSAVIFTDASSAWTTSLMVYESGYALNKKMGNMRSALNNYIKYKAFSDSLSKDRMLINVERIHQKAILERKKIDNHILKDTINREKKYNNILIIISLVLVLFALIFFILVLKLSKKRKELSKSRTILAKNLEEKSLLLTELNHRVKNNLSLILGLMKLQRNNNKIHENDWDQLESRIFTMVTAHKLYSYTHDNINGSSINLYTYLQAIQDSYQDLNNDKINIQLEVDSIHVSVENAMPIGIIYNELLSNSIKHAKPPKNNSLSIVFEISLRDLVFYLTYSDNGTNFKSTVKKSTGSFILKVLTQQLNGTIERTQSTYHITLHKK